MTTPCKLIIAAVILLMGGVVVALVVRPASPKVSQKLALSLMSYETNDDVGVIASILISNTGPNSVRVLIVSQAKPNSGWKAWAVSSALPVRTYHSQARDTLKTTPDLFVAHPSIAITNRVPVPARKPWLVVAVIYSDYAGLFDCARLWFDRHLRRDRYVRRAESVDFCILEIHE